MEIEDMLKISPYSLDKESKQKILSERLNYLEKFHYEHCKEFRAVKDNLTPSPDFIPVRLFKEFDLKSVPDNEIIKLMTSSGTTGQSVSRIFLDRSTALNQQKVMSKIVADFTGASRMPMIILDCPAVLKKRELLTARGAGILGFSIFGTKKIYAFDDDMNLKLDDLKEFINEFGEQKILLFGFTFMIWQYFYKTLKNLNTRLNLNNAVLIHGGGWKKLASESVSADEFKKSLNEICGLVNIHDYYGMIEQTGSIFMQCEHGNLHASIFSDIKTRRPNDFSECNFNERGIIQVISALPVSYPGHSLLTEDEGEILGEDDCPCGRLGKYFKVHGRLKGAELRGCSDTYERR